MTSQSTFVKIISASRQAYFRYQPEASINMQPTKSGLALEVKGANFRYAGGEKAGQDIPEGEIKANQSVSISLGSICPKHYHVMVVVNPQLGRLGSVSHPVIVEPEEKAELDIRLRTAVAGSLADMDWHVRLYLID